MYPRRLRPRPGISIHAPKRERQKSNAPRAYIAFISIHAPKRERLTRQLLPELSPTFQSTLPNGSDHCELIRPPHKFYFNPRSQTGATGFLVKSGDVPVYFNPRSQTGATGCWGPSFFPYGSFQSTLPNGSDARLYSVLINSRISIHAPKRERPTIQLSAEVVSTFQSTLPNGSDIIFIYLLRMCYISIHAPKRERQSFVVREHPLTDISIHAPKRERPMPLVQLIQLIHFNPRSQTGAT